MKNIQKVRLITKFETIGFKTKKELIKTIENLINSKENFEIDYEE